MSKSKMMGAGNACATSYKTNVNLNTYGGNKKQGLPFTVSRLATLKYLRTYGNDKTLISYTNQLGGIGRYKTQFSSNADGVKLPIINNPLLALLTISPNNDLIPLSEFTIYYNKNINNPYVNATKLYNTLVNKFGVNNQISKNKLSEYSIQLRRRGGNVKKRCLKNNECSSKTNGKQCNCKDIGLVYWCDGFCRYDYFDGYYPGANQEWGCTLSESQSFCD